MKIFLLIALVCIPGCSRFNAAKRPAPVRSELIVTGAPTGSVLFLDEVQVGGPTESNKRTHDLLIAPGSHTLEVRMGEHAVYRENTYVAAGEKRVLMVLSGFTRE